MSSREVLSVVGGVVGAFFGYPQLGFVIGGLIGGAVTPGEKTEGPRVQDVKVSVSEYGGGIPQTYGNNVPPATWIWSTDIIEIGTTTKQGKGGAPENTTYRQFIHGYLCLGKSPAAGTTVAIRKVWVDRKLRYDASSGLPVSSALATTENPFAQISIHPGFEDQIPHPIIEAFEGVGNVPAFRGLLGIFVFGLECPGGRVPQISFEVCVGSTVQVVTTTMAAAPALSDPNSAVITSDEIWRYSTTPAGYNVPVYMNVDYVSTEGIRRVGSYRMGILNGDGATPFGYSPFPIIGTDHPTVAWVYQLSGHTYFRLIQLDTGAFTVIADLEEIDANMPGWKANGRGAHDLVSGNYVFASFDSNQVSGGAILINAVGAKKNLTFDYGPALVAFVDGVIYAVTVDSNKKLYLERREASGDASLALPIIPGPTNSQHRLSGGCLCVNEFGVFAYVPRGPSGGASNAAIYRIDLDTQEWISLAGSLGSPVGGFGESVGSYTFYATRDLAITGPHYSTNTFNLTRFSVVVPQPAKVADIISDQSDQAGLLAAQWDVSTIAKTVWGYTTNVNPASARSNIDPLLTYGAIGVVEEDGLIRYFNRASRTSSATIAWDELACQEDGQEAIDAFPLSRSQAAECPRSVTISYLNPDFDYQTSTETARRIVSESILDQQVEIAVAMSPSEAATIARRMLYELWSARMTRSLKVSRKYAYLSAGDVVTVEYPKGTLSNWMLTKLTDTGALIEGECFPFDAELLVQTVPGSNGQQGQQLSPLPPSTLLQLLDIPILRDADNDAGLYAAMEGYTAASWRGAELFVGDDAATLESRGTVANPALIGYATGVLGAWSLNVVDEQNLVTVSIGDGVLNTISKDVLLSGSENVAALGQPGRWEIIKFRQATDIGSGRFTLSGFIRGARGTEHNRANHAAGDVFVLLSLAGTLRPTLEAASIDQPKLYRAVSAGRSFDSAATQTYANTAEGLHPFSPTNLTKTSSSNDITLSWVRRTRLSENWLAGVVPLGEATEAYEVVIYADSTFAVVKRVIPTTSRSAVYTSAQQVADFGTNQSTLYVRVYQISDVVGRGNPLQATI